MFGEEQGVQSSANGWCFLPFSIRRRVTGTPCHRDAASHVELACGSIAFLLPLLLDTCFTKGEVYAL